MSEVNAVVAVYDNHVAAEEAVKELQRGGIDMRTLSLVGRDTQADEQVVGSRSVNVTQHSTQVGAVAVR